MPSEKLFIRTNKWMIINHKVDDYHICPAFCRYSVQPRLLSLSFDFRTIVTQCRHWRPARRAPGKTGDFCLVWAEVAVKSD
jgi:hypothetical protein